MKKLFNLAYIPLFLLLITACSNEGIFYTLENVEKNVDNNNLNNLANFSNMVYTGTYYFGNAGPNIYYRSNSSDTTLDNWAALALPDPNDIFASDATNSSMVLHSSGDLFISRISHDSSYIISGIYRLPNAKVLTPSTVISADWEMIVETITAKVDTTFTYSYYKLFLGNTSLYINHITYDLADTNDTSPTISDSLLYHHASPDTIPVNSNDLAADTTAITISTKFELDADSLPIPVQITKITSSGTNDWMILNGDSIGSLFRSNDNFNADFNEVTSTLTDVTTVTEARYVDVFEYSATHVLLSNTKGSIYISTNTGGTWTESTVKSSAYFNGFTNINGLVPATANTVIVGTAANTDGSTTSGSGYYEIDMSAGTIDWADTDFSDAFNYASSDLADATINGFLYDSTDPNSRLFAFTRAHGVWMNINNAVTGTREWDQE